MLLLDPLDDVLEAFVLGWPSTRFCGEDEDEDGEALICESDDDEVRLLMRELRAASAFCKIGIGRCMMCSLVEAVYG